MKKYVFIGLYILCATLFLVSLYPKGNPDNDLYIEILQFGRANLGSPVSFDQLDAYLTEKGIEYNEFVVMYLFRGAFVDENNPGGNSFGITRDSESFYLHIGGYSELLDHTELQEARISSSKVLFVAVLAIFVSTLFQILSMTFRKEELPWLNINKNSKMQVEKEAGNLKVIEDTNGNESQANQKNATGKPVDEK